MRMRRAEGVRGPGHRRMIIDAGSGPEQGTGPATSSVSLSRSVGLIRSNGITSGLNCVHDTPFMEPSPAMSHLSNL